MDHSPRLDLPYIMASQAQKHVTHNEAVRMLDCLVQPVVRDRTLTAPPASPAEGDGYIVAAAATGAWAGKDGQIAVLQDGAWVFFAPAQGWQVYDAGAGERLTFSGAAWQPWRGGPGLSFLGVNTNADTTNRLSLKSDAALLSHDDVTPGTGSMQLKLNKQATAKTTSILFQTGFSGRAEFQLAGDDNWHVKVSADGAAWTEAMVVMAASGNVKIGSAAGSPSAPLHIFAPAGGGGWTKPFKVHAPTLAVNNNIQFAVGVNETSKNQAEFNFHYEAAGSDLNYFSIGMYGVPAILQLFPTGETRLPLIGTTASAANAYLDSANGNRILRSTSSEAYKRDIEPLDPAYARKLMEVSPIWYRSKAPADDPAWSWYGFSAEAVAAVDPRMVHWGYREEDYETVKLTAEDGSVSIDRRLKDGAATRPDGVAYERFVAHHHVLIGELMERVERLEGATREPAAGS